MSITTITRSLPCLTIINGMKGLVPDIALTRDVPPPVDSSLAASDPYFLGRRFHFLLYRIADHNPLSKQEKALLPWLNALRGELRGLGVTYLRPEQYLPAAQGTPNGRCDLLVEGGLARHGAVEVKVCARMPKQTHCEDLLQVGGYARLLAENRQTTSVWAAVAYIDFRGRRVRVFGYRDTGRLICQSGQLLTAA